jgi:hypothetical protein
VISGLVDIVELLEEMPHPYPAIGYRLPPRVPGSDERNPNVFTNICYRWIRNMYGS